MIVRLFIFSAFGAVFLSLRSSLRLRSIASMRYVRDELRAASDWTKSSMRENSLYIDVLAVPNIVCAIDLAEEQLFQGIDYAMSCNIVGVPSSWPDSVMASAPGSDAPVSTRPLARVRDNRQESAAAYSALAAKVDSSSTAEAHSERKPEQGSRSNVVESSVQNNTGKDVADISNSIAVAEVSDGPSNSYNGPDSQQRANAPLSRQWNSQLKPKRSVLSKRERPTQRPVGAVQDLVPAGSKGPERSGHTTAAKTASGSLEDDGSSAGTRAKLTRLETNGQSVRNSDNTSGDFKERGVKPSGNTSAGGKGESFPKDGILVHAVAGDTGCQQPTTPESLPSPRSRVSREQRPVDPAQSSTAGQETVKSDTLKSNSVVAPRIDTAAKIPGVLFVPGIEPIGSVQPNGYRASPEGLRPVVTLDPRLKVPHSLRQNTADKLFEALISAGISEMDSIVRSTVTEQRYAKDPCFVSGYIAQC